VAWGGREGEDLMQRAAMAVVHEQYQWEARELAAIREAVAVRVAAIVYTEAMAEAARVHVVQE
jgi:lipid II:glycine glycyltransferase (peptidoglycan interpeptide bridge formation enzyme)